MTSVVHISAVALVALLAAVGSDAAATNLTRSEQTVVSRTAARSNAIDYKNVPLVNDFDEESVGVKKSQNAVTASSSVYNNMARPITPVANQSRPANDDDHPDTQIPATTKANAEITSSSPPNVVSKAATSSTDKPEKSLHNIFRTPFNNVVTPPTMIMQIPSPSDFQPTGTTTPTPPCATPAKVSSSCQWCCSSALMAMAVTVSLIV